MATRILAGADFRVRESNVQSRNAGVTLLCCQFTGMFAMSFEDDSGNRLSIPGEITITFPSGGDGTDVTGVQFWTMNANTGWFYSLFTIITKFEKETNHFFCEASLKRKQN